MLWGAKKKKKFNSQRDYFYFWQGGMSEVHAHLIGFLQSHSGFASFPWSQGEHLTEEDVVESLELSEAGINLLIS